jgi:hypothetical protein
MTLAVPAPPATACLFFLRDYHPELVWTDVQPLDTGQIHIFPGQTEKIARGLLTSVVVHESPAKMFHQLPVMRHHLMQAAHIQNSFPAQAEARALDGVMVGADRTGIFFAQSLQQHVLQGSYLPHLIGPLTPIFFFVVEPEGSFPAAP